MKINRRNEKRTRPPCSCSAEPYSLAVSRCVDHGTIELLVNGRNYALPEDLARKVGLALVAAADYRGAP